MMQKNSNVEMFDMFDNTRVCVCVRAFQFDITLPL